MLWISMLKLLEIQMGVTRSLERVQCAQMNGIDGVGVCGKINFFKPTLCPGPGVYKLRESL